MRGPVHAEVAAARATWPTLNGGLPSPVPATLAAGIAAAERRAGALRLPSPVVEEHGLTGPAAGIGGLLRSYLLLVQRGWQFLAAATTARTTAQTGAHTTAQTGAQTTAQTGAQTTAQTGAQTTAGGRRHPLKTPATGGPGAAAFLRSNSPLYLYCVYDGHYDLSLVGKKVADAYDALGGPAGFGAALTPGEVQALGEVYSIPGVRLQPHPPASLKL